MKRYCAWNCNSDNQVLIDGNRKGNGTPGTSNVSLPRKRVRLLFHFKIAKRNCVCIRTYFNMIGEIFYERIHIYKRRLRMKRIVNGSQLHSHG